MRRANRLLRTGAALFAPLLLTTACGWDETKVSISTTGDVVVEAIEQPDNAAAITNKAPIVAGTPSGYAPIDEPYDFVPVAADPDGHKVEFSINNKPQWASFDKNTGRLSGTPRSTDAGLYRDIIVAATDGRTSSTLQPFAIGVGKQFEDMGGIGQAQLSWSRPTQNTDGTPIANLAGYRIYFGRDPNALTNTALVTSPEKTSYQVTGLGRGMWYFAVTSLSSTGVESDLSQIGSKQIS
ncbi:MAG TPA: putative Ig domain-containing protein [Steroidobacteraceae bacterium]|nr:putative Ig domain-containing protein [Steroidobacteraceae bacterium]HRX88068.1 putative Ig domain-containing protein [Steroidobacteraceae bacterium]